jgi:hypothetical protein
MLRSDVVRCGAPTPLSQSRENPSQSGLTDEQGEISIPIARGEVGNQDERRGGPADRSERQMREGIDRQDEEERSGVCRRSGPLCGRFVALSGAPGEGGKGANRAGQRKRLPGPVRSAKRV